MISGVLLCTAYGEDVPKITRTCRYEEFRERELSLHIMTSAFCRMCAERMHFEVIWLGPCISGFCVKFRLICRSC